VIAELKKKQITGEAILPLYDGRLHQIEGIIRAHQLVTLPERPTINCLATRGDRALQPAPHLSRRPLRHNTGQRGEFVLPLPAPAPPMPRDPATISPSRPFPGRSPRTRRVLVMSCSSIRWSSRA
jgi:hypothetical protein